MSVGQKKHLRRETCGVKDQPTIMPGESNRDINRACDKFLMERDPIHRSYKMRGIKFGDKKP